jgi:hypothetical protein
MAKDGSEALGAPEVAGTFVAAKGNTKRLALGGVVGAALASRNKGGGEGGLPAFGRAAYLAVGAEEVALVKTDIGMMSMKPKMTSEALVRVPRGEITSVELDKGALKSALKLSFTDGNTWEFEIPKAYNKGAKGVVEALGGDVT